MSNPTLALGSWHTFDRLAFADTVALLEYAASHGVTTFDIGVYDMPGRPVFTDVIFGAALRASSVSRDRVVVASKVWLDDYPAISLEDQLEMTLARMGMEAIDLGMVGQIDRHQEPLIPQIVKTMSGFVRRGQMQGWGINNWPVEAAEQACQIALRERQVAPCSAQLKYSVARRTVVEEARYVALFEGGLKLQPSDVYEGGILAGKLSPTREIGKDPGKIRDSIVGSAARVFDAAASLDLSPAVFAMAFALSNPYVDNVLFGATSTAQIDAALEAVDALEAIGREVIRATAEPFWLDRSAEGLTQW